MNALLIHVLDGSVPFHHYISDGKDRRIGFITTVLFLILLMLSNSSCILLYFLFAKHFLLFLFRKRALSNLKNAKKIVNEMIPATKNVRM